MFKHINLGFFKKIIKQLYLTKSITPQQPSSTNFFVYLKHTLTHQFMTFFFQTIANLANNN